jgi:hypothetical protein
MRLHSRQPPVVGNLENYPETGFAEIGRERQSVTPHVSQADFWPASRVFV